MSFVVGPRWREWRGERRPASTRVVHVTSTILGAVICSWYAGDQEDGDEWRGRIASRLNFPHRGVTTGEWVEGLMILRGCFLLAELIIRHTTDPPPSTYECVPLLFARSQIIEERTGCRQVMTMTLSLSI